MGFKKPASEQQSNYSCGKCGKKFIKDTDIYMQKKEDGSWFSCHDLECFKSQGGTLEEKRSFGGGGSRFTSSKFAIAEAPQLYNLAETFLETFMKKREENKEETLSIGEQVVFIESIFRTLSGNFKP